MTQNMSLTRVLHELPRRPTDWNQGGNPRTVRISRTNALNDRMARFAVGDTGPGSLPSELARLFEPYWSARQHARKGMGVGLYISKGIVEAHGGRLWAGSEPGEGTTFGFTLPLVVTA